MYTKINEPIKVSVIFDQGKIIPCVFQWGNHIYKIKKVNLVHFDRRGQDKLYYFSVSDEANYFKICFDTGRMRWVLEEMEGY